MRRQLKSFIENIKELEKFESVKRWLSRVRQDGTGSERTTYNYLRNLNFYCGYLKKSPDQLIEEREQELKSEQEKVKHHAEEMLREFCDYIEREAKLSGATMKLFFGTVKSFYKANYQPLQMGTPVRATKQILPAKREEILKMLDYADVREKAVILAFKDSGISREDLPTLKCGDIKDEFEKGIIPIHISLVRGKEKIRYETFLGKDFVEAYKLYLNLRKRKGETLTADSPLFTSAYGEPRPLTVSALADIMWRLHEKSGAEVTPHGLRKFFITSVSLALPKGSPAYLPKYWAGHSLGVESHYFIPSIEEQREAYRQAYEKLAITTKEEMTEEERNYKAVENKLIANLVDLNLPQEEISRRREVLRTLFVQKLKTLPEAYEEATRGLELLSPIRKVKTKTEPNGSGIQVVTVSFDELDGYLEEGWEIMAQNGERYKLRRLD